VFAFRADEFGERARRDHFGQAKPYAEPAEKVGDALFGNFSGGAQPLLV
jgi:hypothetical protein